MKPKGMSQLGRVIKNGNSLYIVVGEFIRNAYKIEKGDTMEVWMVDEETIGINKYKEPMEEEKND